ncbi:serine/threonine dehydratase [Pseudoroseomonas deserti]|uniref:Serine/threonine dehydratase n=1 Tax=Teichococcus deserti TaxID=1817963 RepID=A0A1V2GV38_9PROT|nr:threonine/serine dehydratase [Pseudoroseomonas deserti]ONG46377.1 serine/threonine dehydratase [Pseudoroseomonas deserti]
MPLIDAIEDAAAHRPEGMLVTPLLPSPGLSALLGAEVLLKAEHLQTTGSFKYRGAANAIRLLDGPRRARGVVTASTGNHGQAVALAGRRAGVPVTVFVAQDASPAKLAAIRGHGAELRLLEGDSLAAELAARAEAGASGRVFLSPYNDLDVVAGQGSLGLELLQQAPDLDAVFVAVGGGGLVGGIGTALKAHGAKAAVVGCWPEASPCLLRALEAGQIHAVAEQETLSDGTAGNLEPGAVTLEICARVIDRRVTVSEAAMRRALWLLAEHDRWMVEGAAGVALAGLLTLAEEMRGRRVAVVLCGRNITAAKYLAALNAAAADAAS